MPPSAVRSSHGASHQRRINVASVASVASDIGYVGCTSLARRVASTSLPSLPTLVTSAVRPSHGALHQRRFRRFRHWLRRLYVPRTARCINVASVASDIGYVGCTSLARRVASTSLPTLVTSAVRPSHGALHQRRFRRFRHWFRRLYVPRTARRIFSAHVVEGLVNSPAFATTARSGRRHARRRTKHVYVVDRLLSARECFSKRRAHCYSSRQRHKKAAFPAAIFGKECITGGRKQRLAYSTAEMQSSRKHFFFFFSSGFSRHLGSPLWLSIVSFQ